MPLHGTCNFCLRMHQIQSKRVYFQNFPFLGACPQTPIIGMQLNVLTSTILYIHIYYYLLYQLGTGGRTQPIQGVNP